MISEKNVKLQFDLMYILKFYIKKAYEELAEYELLREKLPPWEEVKYLSDEYLEDKLQNFCNKMEIKVVGTHELTYVANKILEELEQKRG